MSDHMIYDFDLDYLLKLEESLVPTLRQHDGWVQVSSLTPNPEMFVSAVIMLGEQGYFNDQRGWPQVEFDSSCTRIRHIDNKIFYK